MLSVSAITNSGKADYYSKDDYYIGRGQGAGDRTGRDELAGDTRLEWGGRGAAALGLAGVASAEDFKAVLRGRNPDARGPAISHMERREREAAAKARGGREGAGAGPEVNGGEPDRDGLDGKAPGPAPTAAIDTPAGERAAHRPGTDLTFSAPKSISVAILVGGDERLAAAHLDAVKEAMGYAERHFATARVRDAQGQTRTHQTGNLVYAQTTHSSSREGDPMVHTHVPVANTTYVEATKDWRALETRHLFKHQKLLGKIYQASLAVAAKELGYDVRQHKAGTFELEAFKPEELRVFSKATERVEKNLAREAPKTGAAKDIVKRIGRPKKLDIGPHELVERWEREAERAEFSPRDVVDYARVAEPGRDVTPTQQGLLKPLATKVAEIRGLIRDGLNLGPCDPYGYGRKVPPGEIDRGVRAGISYAVQGAEERRAVFSRHDVIERAIDLAPTSRRVGLLERDLEALAADGRVMVTAGIGKVTTKTALGLEAEIVGRMQAGVGAAKPVYALEAGLARLKPDAVLAAGHAQPINKGQTAAAAMILTSADRIVAVHGAAGGGKTTMFEVVNKAAAEKKLELFGLTPSHSAKGALIEKAGIATNVVAWFTNRYSGLTQGQQATPEERRVWASRALVIDEASMLSNVDAAKILRIAEALGIKKTVFVGDQRQHNSPAAGAPFRHLINAEIPVARMEEIMRQKDDSLRFAVIQLSKGKAIEGVRGLNDRIIEVGAGKGDAGLAQQAFALWRDGKADGVSRPIIVQTQVQRAMINGLVARDLVARGEIAPTGNEATRLVLASLEGPARWNAGAYALDQVLVFHAGHKATGIAKGDQVRIVGIDDGPRRDLLTVERRNGKLATIDLRALGRRDKFQTYDVKPGGEIYIGGLHVWERSDVGRGFATGEAFTPLADRGDRYEVRLASGAVVEIAKTDPHLQFIGAGYAMTSQRSQSQTMETAPIGVMASRNADLATLYVQASRGVHDYTLVTDDKRRLLAKVGEMSGMNLIAHGELAGGQHEPHHRGALGLPDLAVNGSGPSANVAGPIGDREDASQRSRLMEKSIVRDLPMELPEQSL